MDAPDHFHTNRDAARGRHALSPSYCWMTLQRKWAHSNSHAHNTPLDLLPPPRTMGNRDGHKKSQCQKLVYTRIFFLLRAVSRIN